MKKKLYSYKNSGVNISLGNKFVKHIGKLTKKNVKKANRKKHKNNIEGLISELTEKVEKSHKKELFRKLLSEVESVKSSARNEGFLRRTEKIIQVIDWINTSEKHSPIDFDIVNCELLRKDFFSQIVDVESPICSRNLLTTKLLSARSFSNIEIQDSTNNVEK